MSLYHKETKTIYQGKEMWVQVDPKALQETGEIKTVGEPVVADASITKCDRNGFEITYLAYLFDVFDQLGGQKYKVFKYIMEHKSTDNTLIISQRELADKCGVGTQCVNSALKLLKEKGLIATRTGAIMILPKIAHRGKAGREQFLMHKFEEFSNEENNDIK